MSLFATRGDQKVFAIQFDAQRTKAKQLHHFSVLFTSAHLRHWSKRSLVPVK